MQEEPSTTPWLMLLVAGPQVRLNIAIVKKDLSPFQTRERTLQVHESRSNRLDLRALEFDAGLKSFQDMIISERLAISYNFCGHGTPAREGLFFGLLAVG